MTKCSLVAVFSLCSKKKKKKFAVFPPWMRFFFLFLFSSSFLSLFLWFLSFLLFRQRKIEPLSTFWYPDPKAVVSLGFKLLRHTLASPSPWEIITHFSTIVLPSLHTALPRIESAFAPYQVTGKIFILVSRNTQFIPATDWLKGYSWCPHFIHT